MRQIYTLLQSFASRHVRGLSFSLLLIFLFLLYFPFIFFDLGRMTYAGDEAHVVFSVLKFFRDWNFTDPYAYALPVMTISYVPFLAFSFLLLFWSGVVGSIGELTYLVQTQAHLFVPVFRFVTILFALASLWLIYSLITRVTGRFAIGLLAAYITGTSLVFVKMAGFALKWIPQLFFSLLAVWYAWRCATISRVTTQHYVVAGILSALSYGVAFVGLVVVFPFLIAFWSQKRKGQADGFYKGILLFLIVTILGAGLFTISSPTLVTNSFQFAQEVVETGSAEPLLEENKYYRFYGYIEVFALAEPLLLLISIPGFILLYRRYRTFFWMVASYIFVYYVILGPVMEAIRQRRLILIIPFFATTAALSLYWVWNSKRHVLGRALVLVVLVLLLIQPLLLLASIYKPHSKHITREWIYENVSVHALIVDECLLELQENEEYFSYVETYLPEHVTTKIRALQNDDSYLRQVPSYLVLFDSTTTFTDTFEELIQTRPVYYVFCTQYTAGSEEHKREYAKKANQYGVDRLEAQGTLREVFRTESGEDHTHPHVLVAGTNIFSLFTNRKDSYVGDHATVFFLERER